MPCRWSPCSGCGAGEGVEGEDLDVGSVVGSGVVEDRDEAFVGAGDVVGGVHRGEQAVAERGLLSASGGAMPRRRRLECGPRRRELSERTQDAPEMDAGECGHACVAGGFCLVDRELEGGGAGVVVAGLALGAAEAGGLVRLGLQEAETSRRLRGATDVDDGVVEAMLEAGQFAEHRVAANVQPRVVDLLQPVLDVDRRPRRCAPRRRPRSRLWRRTASSRPDPRRGPVRRTGRGCGR